MGDGCSLDCNIEKGWECTPVCIPICGDSVIVSDYDCDSNDKSKTEQNVLIIGVVVGCLVVIIIIFIILLIFFKRKERYMIKENEIEMISVVSEGNFGQVRKALWKGTTEVAVKVVKMSSQQNKELEKFKKEAKFYTTLPPHPNIVQLLGICIPPALSKRVNKIRSSNITNDSLNVSSSISHGRDEAIIGDGQVMIVLEYLATGNLVSWMKRNDFEGCGDEVILFVYLSKGIAAGMHHLHSNGVVHKDLSARNIMIKIEVQNSTERLTKVIPKIGDFGLSFSSKASMKIPVRWSAPEVLRNYQTSIKASDVWSFGVVLFEIFSKCQILPYQSLTNKQVVELALNSNEMFNNIGVIHPKFSSLISICLLQDSNLRPTFSKIFEVLNSMEQELKSSENQTNIDSKINDEDEDDNDENNRSRSKNNENNEPVLYQEINIVYCNASVNSYENSTNS